MKPRKGCWYSVISYVPEENPLVEKPIGVVALCPNVAAAAIRMHHDAGRIQKLYPTKQSKAKLAERTSKVAHSLVSQLRMEPTVTMLQDLINEHHDGSFRLAPMVVKNLDHGVALEDEIETLFTKLVE